jgi:hypothetical protein
MRWSVGAERAIESLTSGDKFWGSQRVARVREQAERKAAGRRNETVWREDALWAAGDVAHEVGNRQWTNKIKRQVQAATEPER